MPDHSAWKAHLATGSTTRARCWGVTRRDGGKLGFTDHDRGLGFAGFTFEPSSAVEPSEVSAQLGLAADDMDIMGALTSAAVTAEDIANGLYDGAEVEVFEVDWTNSANHVRLARFVVGDIERTESSFRAELRSVSTTLGKRVGRSFLTACDAELGDARCGVNVTEAPFAQTSSVASLAGLTLTLTSLGTRPDGFFSGGRLAWTSGANAGRVSVVRQHVQRDGGAIFHLWRALPDDIAPGDAFEVRAGCDKSWTTCNRKFGNAERFRGFPHIPSESFPARYARRGDPKQDGKPSNPKPPPPIEYDGP